MGSFERRLLDIQRVDAPDLWTDIASRPLSPFPGQPRRRWIVVAVAGAIAIVGVAIPLWLLRPGGSVRPSSGGEHQIIPVGVVSNAMEPTLSAGQVVQMDVDAYKDVIPSREDIIVFTVPESPGLEFIKRVIGLPGDTVEIRNGVVFVNGEPLSEPYLGSNQDTSSFQPQTVQAGHLFVLGDNRANSNDSRFGLGQVSIDQVVGKVIGVVGGGAASTP
jgi:signal peptidase I